MLELLKSLVFAVIMVPVVMAIILGLIYGLGEVFNIFSRYRSERPVQTEFQFWNFPPKTPAPSSSAAFIFFAFPPVLSRYSFSRSCFLCRYFLCVTSNW